jgi:hypothetical protein
MFRGIEVDGSTSTIMTLPRDKKPPEPDSKGPVTKGADHRGKSAAGKGERAFDAWLKQGLHKLYDDVASEPVPESLLKMIEQDRKK